MPDKCPICDEWLFKSEVFGRQHKCPPAWWCWISDPDYGYERDDGMTIYNIHAGDAAAEYIERWDADGDYVCIGGDDMQVSVSPLSHPEQVKVFTVSGEMVPEYYTKEIKEMEVV